MIPDVTPNGVFYLPPTGWLTSFYNPPKKIRQLLTEAEVFARFNKNNVVEVQVAALLNNFDKTI
ncbi:hypothetical protein LMB61_02165, partial [Limosilactobacillus reuteri]|nr:hypothetical protein [Limosilactobacillus reuteri]